MEILITKGDRADRIEARCDDGTIACENVPHKGPVAHDLVHYVVETELGFDRGFWGLVAAGSDPQRIAELAKAAGHASAKRAVTPEPHFVEAIQVERIVESFEAELWSRGADNESLRAMVRAGCDQSMVPFPDLSDEEIEWARVQLAALADQWAGLAVGEALTLDWPERTRAAA